MKRKRKTKTRQRPEAVYVPYEKGAARFIGTYDPERRLYVKRVRQSAHLFRKLDAWGIDAEYFTEKLKARGACIRVHDIETGMLYQTTVSQFLEWGEYLTFKGHRAQIFLPRVYWDQVQEKPPQLESPKTLGQRAVAVMNGISEEMQALWDSIPDSVPDNK